MQYRFYLFFLIIFIFLFSGCSKISDSINVISREDGSGTRDAFTSLFNLNQEIDGIEKDQTLKTAEVTNSTAVVLQTVSEDPNAIGYISMGSLNNHVKPISINKIEPTLENIKSSLYPIYRPFLLIKGKTNGEIDEDFISFIKSKDGKKVIEENGYISNSDSNSNYKKSRLSGKIVINGSSSVTPVMESLAEKYEEINPQIEVEVQQTDSTTGISSISEGIATLGMSSRELKDEEIELGLNPEIIAYDGLAVIVNNKNLINDLSVDQVHSIYTGKIKEWNEVLN